MLWKNLFFSLDDPWVIGCALSHLSVIRNAYDAGYQTIWVLEDDIAVEQDPHRLSALIDKLDSLVGKEGWDILYTDTDRTDSFMYEEENDFESDLKGGPLRAFGGRTLICPTAPCLQSARSSVRISSELEAGCTPIP